MFTDKLIFVFQSRIGQKNYIFVKSIIFSILDESFLILYGNGIKKNLFS